MSAVQCGRYLLAHPLGVGGFGAVYAASCVGSGESVALKVLQKRSPDAAARFVREANYMRALAGSRHVVHLLEDGTRCQMPFLAMELGEASLRTWVGKKVPWQQVALALRDSARGLRDIHALGGFHRDIKPDNLIIKDGLVKLSDFGLARLPTVDGPISTARQGTSEYWAPEVKAGHPYHWGADIYALGLVGVELLTGQRVPSLAPRPEVPLRLATVVNAMLSVNPRGRPAAGQVVDEMERLLAMPSTSLAQAQPQETRGLGGLFIVAVAVGLLGAYLVAGRGRS